MAELFVTGWKHSTTNSLRNSICVMRYFTLLPRYSITYANTIPCPTWRLYRVLLLRSYKHQRGTVMEYSTATQRARVKIRSDPRSLFLISFLFLFHAIAVTDTGGGGQLRRQKRPLLWSHKSFRCKNGLTLLPLRALSEGKKVTFDVLVFLC